MTLAIARFQVRELHRSTNVDIPFKGGRGVLTGVNGLGKTTLMTLLYLVLSRQWRRLLEFEFAEIIVEFPNATLRVKREELETALPARFALFRHAFRGFPPSFRERIDQHPELFDVLTRSRPGDTATLIHLSEEFDVPLRILERMRHELMSLAAEPQGRLFDEYSALKVQDEIDSRHVDGGAVAGF